MSGFSIWAAVGNSRASCWRWVKIWRASAPGVVAFSSWTGYGGTALNNIPKGTLANTVSNLGQMETPTDRGDNLGSRLCGDRCGPCGLEALRVVTGRAQVIAQRFAFLRKGRAQECIEAVGLDPQLGEARSEIQSQDGREHVRWWRERAWWQGKQALRMRVHLGEGRKRAVLARSWRCGDGPRVHQMLSRATHD